MPASTGISFDSPQEFSLQIRFFLPITKAMKDLYRVPGVKAHNQGLRHKKRKPRLYGEKQGCVVTFCIFSSPSAGIKINSRFLKNVKEVKVT
jgi:hypothetical protein